MFTVEHDENSTGDSVVVILDETAEYPDVEAIFFDGGVWIRQYNEDLDTYDLIQMTDEMFKELIYSVDVPAGMYSLRKGK